MAEEQQQQLISPFPAPPPFYKHFTKQNRDRVQQLRREAGASQNDGAKEHDIDTTTLPPELGCLVPPPPPSTSKFTVFGHEIDLQAPQPTLAEAGIEQLYPEHPSVTTTPQPHLIALSRSLLTTFLSLTGILAANPELYEERVLDLQAIVFNMHSLINQYRPHQARESLIMLMEDRVEKMRAETRAIEEGREKVAKLLEGMKQHADYAPDVIAVNGKKVGERNLVEARKKGRRSAAWQMLEAEMG